MEQKLIQPLLKMPFTSTFKQTIGSPNKKQNCYIFYDNERDATITYFVPAFVHTCMPV